MRLFKNITKTFIGLSLLCSSSALSLDVPRGLFCIDQEGLESEWTETDQPIQSVISHWFDKERVYTTSWSRKNDLITRSTDRFGIKYSTDSKFIRWPLNFLDDEEKIVEINRADATRSIKLREETISEVDCYLNDDAKEYNYKIIELHTQLQKSYDKAISDHKL